MRICQRTASARSLLNVGITLTSGLALVATLLLPAVAMATIPYKVTGKPFPGFGPGVIAPVDVGGKEYTHDRDHEVFAATPPNTGLDPQQIVAWDGIAGASGVTNVTDYSFTRGVTAGDPDLDIDAIANRRDFAYRQLKEDRAHLIFSFDDTFTGYSLGGPVPLTLPPGTPPGVILTNGNTVGGSGELSVELCAGVGCAPNAPDTQLLWAGQLDINGMGDPIPGTPDFEPRDIDGVELWGPEPPLADADKYSLDVDVSSVDPGGGGFVSVWNGSGTPYIYQSTIITAVTTMLGDPFSTSIPLIEEVNLDALMVQDVAGEVDDFGRDPDGRLDEIIFSIRQIPDPGDPDGYYATGSELFVLDAAGGVSYLTHGGHMWSHMYALSTFNPPGAAGGPNDQQFAVFDINAIEAVGEFSVPEPSTLAIGALALTLAGVYRRRM